MRALPTPYAGIEFRSRLEADWACSLDAVGIPWLYEPEGFELADGSWYAPDFYLPTSRAWLEIKGPHGERLDKVEAFAAEAGVTIFTGRTPRRDFDGRWVADVNAHADRCTLNGDAAVLRPKLDGSICPLCGLCPYDDMRRVKPINQVNVWFGDLPWVRAPRPFGGRPSGRGTSVADTLFPPGPARPNPFGRR